MATLRFSLYDKYWLDPARTATRTAITEELAARRISGVTSITITPGAIPTRHDVVVEGANRADPVGHYDIADRLIAQGEGARR